ncbi:hypothetical protein ACFRH4_28995, partial [Streptomyces mirabilis]|uniref:hypothetical protein n=1 Tax=Streptomyces mirabilis TaxID=68239 RepID=UPI00369A02A4
RHPRRTVLKSAEPVITAAGHQRLGDPDVLLDMDSAGFTRMEPASERAAASSPWLNSTRDKPCQAATWSLSCTDYPATSVGSSFGLSG